MSGLITVAIPTLNGASVLGQTLAAVRSQREIDVELVVCDSGSRDGTVAIARRHGAVVIEIPPSSFSHGATRNLLMERSHGEHVAFLTQDAVPAHPDWLQNLLAGFGLADDVALVFGPYRPRPDASPMVARELTDWFASFSPDGSPKIERLSESERDIPARELLGARAFFTDANGCVSRAAWQAVPFRSVAYAEDQALALDMLRAGYAKAFVPSATVIHSHEYSGWGWLRRAFDEARALHDVYGFQEPLGERAALKLWGRVGADWRWAREHRRAAYGTVLARSAVSHGLRMAGAALGSRAERLPPALVRVLSLEGRG